MSKNTDYILSLCHSLSEKGLTPTVGLIRSKATRALTVPEVISTLKRWKENPASYNQIASDEMAPTEHASSEATLEARVNKLEKEVAMLKALIEKSRTQLIDN
ncbi:hypothetical protein OE749_00950 [Aestuariibacter sp. AA17]|uniref:KfrA N-terminal DNA-binding domain-containing protein n=1 Tax=Fluctibacter corallii TaxID=2984329 RepID=A0ABT3A4F0_9ALTE|nr:hypothetical protein [Aestuariibacter sp. AA17]MCV2883261.1 hypothetical protein [Aestuariibacter sp. AA17]